MANIVSWAKVIQTRHDLITVQHGTGSVMEDLRPEQLGLSSGHQLGLNTRLHVHEDGTLSLPEGTDIGPEPGDPETNQLPEADTPAPPRVDDLGESG